MAEYESTPQDEEVQPKKFYRWRTIVVVTLLLLYTAYYFNRSHVSVATPQILEDTGLNKTEFGTVLSVGYGVYAIGKVVNGILIDMLGGKPMFLFGLLGSACATIGFTFFSDIPGFTVMWSINRFLQSMGWGALVKVTSKWFGSKEYGRIMGVMSLSYMLGDAVIRLVYGFLLNSGFTWEEIFYVAAGIAVASFVVGIFTLKNSPEDVGCKEPKSSEKSVYKKEGQETGKISTLDLLIPIFKAPKFWILVILSTILTLIRETFNTWTPTYLTEDLGLDDGDASIASMVFPLMGTVSAVIGGFLVDYVPAKWRGGVPVVFLIGQTCALGGLFAFAEYYKGEGSEALSLCLVLIGATALFLIAPYSFLDGVFTLELSGKQGCAATASIINAAGYVGAILSGTVTGYAADGGGWGVVFLMMAGVSVVAVAGSVIYWILDLRDLKRSPEEKSLLENE